MFTLFFSLSLSLTHYLFVFIPHTIFVHLKRLVLKKKKKTLHNVQQMVKNEVERY
jgi:hypothetical protein